MTRVWRADRAVGFPDAEQHAAAGNGWERHSSLFITLYIHISDKRGPIPRRIRIESFGAGDAHIATRCAPGAPHRALSSLDEHGLLCGDLGRRARYGAPVYGSWRL